MTAPAARSQSLADLEARKRLAEAEAEALRAETALAAARRELEAATSAADPADEAQAARLAALRLAKEEADARKATADARAAESEAASAAAKARIGEIPDPPYAGGLTIKEKAGTVESALLAAKAATTAAAAIAAKLPAADKAKPILLYAASDVPRFDSLMLFRAQEALVTRALNEALKVSDQAMSTAPPESTAAPASVTPLGVGLEAVDRLLGFFRTEYTIEGVDVTLDESLVLHAVAAAAHDQGHPVLLPGVYMANALTDPGSSLVKSFLGLAGKRQNAAARAEQHEELAKAFKERAAQASEAERPDLLGKAGKHEAAGVALSTSIETYEAVLGKLTTADEKGAIFLSSVLREAAISDQLEGGARLLVIRLQQAGGAYYAKKNMWTFLGAMPFYHMGGVVVSFTLLDGPQGHVEAGGVIPVHGGFVKSGAVKTHVGN